MAVLSLLLPPVSLGQVLDPAPAWGGRFVEGRTTEAIVRVVSPVGGEVRLLADGDEGRIRYRALLEADRPHVAAVPVSPGPAGRVQVTAAFPDGTSVADEIHFLPQQARLAIEVVEPPSDALNHARTAADALPVFADALPRSAAGYGPVASIALSPASLARLDAQQTEALADYVAGCGPLALRAVSQAVLERMRNYAGCGGRYVTASGPAGGASDAVPGEADRRPPTPVLERLLSDPAQDTVLDRSLLLLLPYPLLLLAVASGRRLGAWLLLLPSGAALAYAWVLPLAADGATAVTLAWMEAGDTRYRFASLLELRGGGQAQPPLRLPASVGVLSSADPGTLEWAVDGDDGSAELPFPHALLQQRRYRIEGSRPARAQPRLEPADGGVRLVNGGPDPIPAGWLRRHGETYEIPPVPAGESRLLDLGMPTAPPFPGLDALASAPGTALVLPLSGTLAGDRRLGEIGWVRIAIGGAGP